MIEIEITKKSLWHWKNNAYSPLLDAICVDICKQAEEIKTGIYRHDGEYWEFVEAK